MKLPKTITHEAGLRDAGEPLEAFLQEVGGLGERLGCLLVQLPPRLEFDARVARSFFELLRTRLDVSLACEPRHASWFHPEAEVLLREQRVARVAADPDRPVGAGRPGGWPGMIYHRLHGSPRIYYSGYSDTVIDDLAERLARARESGIPSWCIFDNTASGAAAGDALRLCARLDRIAGDSADSA